MSIKRILTIVYICLSLVYIFAPIHFAPPASDLAAFTRELDERVPRFLKIFHIPGASVALIQNGQVAWANSYGLADVQQRAPVSTRTIFQAASISKTVTAWGVMKLVDEGKLALDAPAETYLHRWHIPASDFDPRGVTVRRLLNHTSGLADVEFLGYPPGQPLPTLEESLTNGPPAPTGRMKDSPGSMNVGSVRLVAPPGQRYVYSDANYVVLQLLIEEVTGESFADYMQGAVLTPLGMTDSSFARTPELIARTATPYDFREEPLPDYRFTELAPAGLYTTASDLARFVAAGLGELAGSGVISPASVQWMITPAARIPGFDGWVYANAYGLGYFIDTPPNGKILISHMGGNLGWSCEFAASPSTGNGIVIMTNGSTGHEVFSNVLTAWTDWQRLDEARVAHSTRLAQRLFQTLTVSMCIAAMLLSLGLIAGIRAGKRRFDLRHLPWSRTVGAVICIVALLLYWTIAHPLLQINLPSQAPGLLTGVTFLGLTIFSNILFSQTP